MEEFLTGAILSGIAYEVMKCGVVMSIDELKQRLKGWLISDSEILVLADELKKLELTNEMSETAIERKISDSHDLQKLIKNIKHTSECNTIIQHHSGSGDNIGRDKIIHSGK
ncbi:MAG: hypothetical protein M0R33_16355 [Methylomonas sp.]|jgi:hypothetical protein|uniref:GapS6a family protein n=1 Tax=Methylomonas sp. TaxID=418 RepID=UPI0025EBDC3D|nr:hypothetical protein [Methylomonas sp.]MCK9608015.1 hypothetical protein [Methylomonas sp.]